MRNLVLALLGASGLAMVGAAPAEAVGTRYPYCIQGNEIPGLANATSPATSSARPPRRGGFSPASKIRTTIPAPTEIPALLAAATACRLPIPGTEGASEGGTDASSGFGDFGSRNGVGGRTGGSADL